MTFIGSVCQCSVTAGRKDGVSKNEERKINKFSVNYIGYKKHVGDAVPYELSFWWMLLGWAVMWSPTSEISPFFAAVMMSGLPAILAAAAA